jgi:hypothetical protein
VINKAMTEEGQSGEDKVIELRLAMEPGTSKSRGYAYLEMASEQAVEEALVAMKGLQIMGRVVRVDYADPALAKTNQAKKETPKEEVRYFPFRFLLFCPVFLRFLSAPFRSLPLSPLSSALFRPLSVSLPLSSVLFRSLCCSLLLTLFRFLLLCSLPLSSSLFRFLLLSSSSALYRSSALLRSLLLSLSHSLLLLFAALFCFYAALFRFLAPPLSSAFPRPLLLPSTL